jgi:hypothetical protein
LIAAKFVANFCRVSRQSPFITPGEPIFVSMFPFSIF